MTSLSPYRVPVGNSDGRLLATPGADGAVRLWDPFSGWLLATLEGHQGPVSAIAFLPDGRTLASSGQTDRTIRLWDLGSLRQKLVLNGTRTCAVNLAWRADGRLLASDDCADGTVHLWNPTAEASRCREIRLFPAPVRFLHGVAMTPEGRYLATANPDVAAPGVAYEIPPDPVELEPKAALDGHDGSVTWSAFSPDGLTFATAGKDGKVKLRDAADGKERLTLAAHKDGVRLLVFARDGKTLATAGFDGVIRIWDSAGKKVHELAGHKGSVAALLFAPKDGRLLSAGADGSVRLWDVAKGKEVRKLDVPKEWVTHLTLTPDGKTLATGGNDGIVRLWDLDTGQVRRSLPQRRGVCFSPDGTLLAVVTSAHHIELRDAELQVRALLVGRTDTPDGLSFSGDGKRLASCGVDCSIRLWDVEHGHLLATLTGHVGRAWAVTLSADGKTLAAGGEDGKLVLWDLSGVYR